MGAKIFLGMVNWVQKKERDWPADIALKGEISASPKEYQAYKRLKTRMLEQLVEIMPMMLLRVPNF